MRYASFGTDIVIAVERRVEPKPRAENDHHIRLFRQPAGHTVSARPRLTSEPGMTMAHHIRVAGRCNDGNFKLFSQRRQRFAALPPFKATACKYHRPLRG